jgi:AraC-like DNA-binding protein
VVQNHTNPPPFRKPGAEWSLGVTLETSTRRSPAERERRIVNDFSAFGINEVTTLGRYEYHEVKPGLAEHAHPDAIEICYLERGCQTYRASGREYNLVGGDLFVTGPGEAHDTAGQREDCGILYWLILKLPREGEPFLMLPPAEGAVLAARLSHLQKHQFPGRPVFKQIFHRLFEIYDAPNDDLKRIMLVSQLLCCMLEILDCSRQDDERHCSREIRKTVEYIRSAADEQITLLELAERAQLSLSRFKTKFKKEMGVGPHEFILRTRIEQAKHALLRHELSVTDIAMRFGFSSSQYFATVFRRFTDMTPGEFRSGLSAPMPLREHGI